MAGSRPIAFACLTALVVGWLVGFVNMPRLRAPAARADDTLSYVSFYTAPGASVLVHGVYPKTPSPCVQPIQPVLHIRLVGEIRVGWDTDGTLFVNAVLPFEQYLQGIAEMPRTWPMAALRAQAVAARSYALANLAFPDPTAERLGYDLCATTACQVYRGLSVSAGPYGTRWVRAVHQTSGQVLLYQGRPADTLYFSTSNGSTLGNDQVFGTAPLPYLRPVVEKDDGASPLSHWQSTIALADVGTFLHAAGAWGTQKVASVVLSGTSNVVVSGGGASKTLAVTDFRSDLNYWAPCLDPGAYPPTGTNGIRLPQTVPSKWFTPSTSGGDLVLTGRGWGHGVGMVQWGAYGKALRGLSASDILAAYYGGLRPTPYDEPEQITIGIASGLQSVTVDQTGTGEVTPAGAGQVSGPWLVTGGSSFTVVHDGAAPTYLPNGRLLSAPKRVDVGRSISATVSIPTLCVAQLAFRVEGADVRVGKPVTVPAGTTTLSGTVPNLPPGTYRLALVVTDGTDLLRTKGWQVFVAGGTIPPSPSFSAPPPAPSSTSPTLALPPVKRTGVGAVIVIGALVLLALAALLYIRHQAGGRASPGS